MAKGRQYLVSNCFNTKYFSAEVNHVNILNILNKRQPTVNVNFDKTKLR